MKHISTITKLLFCIAVCITAKNNASSLYKVCDKVPTNPINHSREANTVLFTENKGQVTDQNYKQRPDVLFGGNADGMAYHLRKTGISYQFSRVDTWKKRPTVGSKGLEPNKNKAGKSENKMVPDKTSIYRVDITWLNCNSECRIQHDEALHGVENYFINGGRVTNVKTYAGVTYKNIYNNIDLHYYNSNAQLKYDFIVAPHANYKQIKLKVSGAKNIELQPDGSVLIKTPLGDISEGAPLVYQDGKELSARWVINYSELSLDIKGYNADKVMIIDPISRSWGTYYGGSIDDEVLSGITSDGNGNIYVVGNAGVSTGTVIATTGAYQTTYAGGGGDVLVAKFTSLGQRVWATYYGGTGSEIGHCITYSKNNIYFSGTTDSNNAISTSTNVFQPAYGGGAEDCLLGKLSAAAGTPAWVTYYGGTGDETPMDCPADTSGNVYMCGKTTSNTSTIIATANSHQPVFGTGFTDIFLVKFSPTGSRIWATYYGGDGTEDRPGACTDIQGNVYLSGATTSTTSSVISSTGAHQTSNAGLDDAFLVKFNSNGVRQWGTFYGSTGDEFEGRCAVDASGSIYLVGSTNSVAGIITTGAYQTTFGGQIDAFLVKFSNNGVRQWGTYYGGANNDGVYNIACTTDQQGNVLITGTTDSPSGIATTASHQTNLAGSFDAYFAIFSGNGAFLYGTYFGSLQEEVAGDIHTNGGDIYICGHSNAPITNTAGVSSSNIFSAGAHQTTFAGLTDAYLAKFNDCAGVFTPVDQTPASNRTVCSTKSTSLYASAGSSFPSWFATASSTTILLAGTPYVTPLLTPGTHTFYAGVAGTCSNSVSRTAITLTVLLSPTLVTSNPSVCANYTAPSGGTTTINFSGNANSYVMYTPSFNTVSISAPTVVVIPPSMGVNAYTITGTAGNGCDVSNVSNVTLYPQPTIYIPNGYACSGGSFTLNPTGAATYTYSSGSAVVTPTVNTSYTITGKSAQGCTATNTAVVTISLATNPVINATGGITCQGQAFTIVPSGADTYSYSGSTNALAGNVAVVTPSATTSFSIVGTDTITGCTATNPAVASVTVKPSPTISLTGSASICSGDSTTITATGADSYTWNGGAQGAVFTVTSAISNASSTVLGNVVASNTNGCSNSMSINVVILARPFLSSNSGSICNGASFTIVPGGAGTYSYSGGSSVVSPTAPTVYSYSVTGTSSSGCLATNTAVSSVTVVANPTVVAWGTTTLCAGNTASLATGGTANSYTWSNASTATLINVSPTVTTTYSVIGKADGCTNLAALTVTVMALPTISITGPSSICYNSSAVLTGGGASSYTWSSNSNSSSIVITPSVNTTYTLLGTDNNGCIGSKTKTITVIALPVLSVTGNNGVCPGGSAVLQVTGATSYTWSTGINSGLISVSPAGTTAYTVQGTSAAGCVNSAVKTVSVYTLPAVSATVSNPAVCKGGSVTLGGVGAVTYTWFGGAVNNVPFAPNSTTSYTVTGTDANGCKNSAVTSVTVNPLPVVTVTSTATRICQGETATLTTAGAATYLWNNGILSPSLAITPNLTQSYTVTGTDTNGCSNTTSITINVIACTGVVEKIISKDFNLYPNPASGVIKLTIPADYLKENTDVEIYNVIGQVVYHNSINETETIVDVSRFSNGMYFVKVTFPEATIIKRIIKE